VSGTAANSTKPGEKSIRLSPYPSFYQADKRKRKTWSEQAQVGQQCDREKGEKGGGKS